MKPKNKIERQIYGWSKLLPGISHKQDKWALKHCTNVERAYSNNQRISRGSFYIITTYKGWQVLRYFQIKAHFAYHKLKKHLYIECMQHWLKDGKYVFLSLPRQQGWCNDAFINNEMEIRRGYKHCGLLCDPRELGYDNVYVVRIQGKYKYIWNDVPVSKDDIYTIFRAANTSPYAETLLRNDYELFKTALNKGFLFDKEKMCAIKIANRYHYDLSCSSLWWDMIDNLSYLRKDLHNPQLVCPKNLHIAHDKWMKVKMSKMKKNSDKMSKLRQLAAEKAELRYMEECQRQAEKQKEFAKSMAQIYIAKRKKYFGFDISDGTIDIQVLKSVQEFYEEGKEMCHCVFANKYFDVNHRPNCVILSAKVDNKRVETIEIDTKDMKIVQCHGKHNMPSEYHDRIVKLMNDNIQKIAAL